jgi:hypothetical protein
VFVKPVGKLTAGCCEPEKPKPVIVICTLQVPIMKIGGMTLWITGYLIVIVPRVWGFVARCGAGAKMETLKQSTAGSGGEEG